MTGMIKYEWKKIWGSRLTQLSIIGCSLFLLFCVYSSITQIMATDKNGEVFYGMSAVDVMKDTHQEKYNRLTAAEADYWKEKVKDSVEYKSGYFKGWSMILDAMTWPVLIMMIICVGIAPIFAGEYQSKCDSLILCMKYGKSRLITAKVIAVWLYTTCVYWGITLLMSARLKNAYGVIIIAFLFLIVPTFLSPDAGGYI